MKKIFIILIMLFSIIDYSFSQTSKPSVKISGEVITSLNLTSDDLAAMKRVNSSVKDRDGKVYNYTGVAVTEILKKAGVTLGKDLRGENLSKYLLVRASDGYEVLFSLAELDSSFTDRVIILADTKNGKPIEEGKGPFRIIVPNEKKPARCIFQVVEFIVGYGKTN